MLGFASLTIASRTMDPAIQKLLDESRALRHEDPQAMLALARQAVRAANHLPQNLARERCESWAHYANALRVCNRFRESRGAFRHAWVAFEKVGDHDPLLAARLHELEASLQEATRQFAEAAHSLDKALQIRLCRDDGAAIGSCLLQRANVAGHSGDPAAAIRYLKSALNFPARDSATAFALVHNLAWFLVDAGNADVALSVVLEYSAIATPPLSTLLALRSRWLNARILVAASTPQENRIAQLELAAVRDEFSALGLPFDAALAGLELLSLQSKPDGRSLMALQQIFDALGVEREALAAKLLASAAEDERLDILAPQIGEALHALRAIGGLKSGSTVSIRIDRTPALP